MNNKIRRPAWYGLIGPVGAGAVAIVILTIVIFVAMSPASAIGTAALPEDVRSVPVNVGVGPTGQTGPTPTPQPVPTVTPRPDPTATPVVRSVAPDKNANADPTPTPLPEPTAVPTPLPPLPGVLPGRLRIPNLGINAPVEQVGKDDQNRMDVPHNIWNVAWYKLGPKPGERGNAVIDGHLDGQYGAAVFWNLNKLKPGDRIYIQGDNRQEKVFEVFDVQTYAYSDAPMDRIFGGSNDAQLNLITCSGQYDYNKLNYDQRFVAYSRLVPNP